MPHSLEIFVCTEDTNGHHTLSEILSSELPDAHQTAIRKSELLSSISETNADLLLLDCAAADNDELSKLLEAIASLQPQLLIILIIPENRRDLFDFAVDHNIFLYFSSPFDDSEVNFVISRAIQKIRHTSRHHDGRQKTSRRGRTAFPGFIGKCEVMQGLFQLITRIAEDEFSTVLIRGESGTGKELVARAIHASSKRVKNNFVPVNCAAIPDDLLESELFGHIKGSFTGATQSKQGRIQYADGGTLFLDEIGDMKPTLQAKLLRVLQEKEFEPVGSLKAIPVNTRILAATHCNLEELVTEGTFREDLYYRLSVIPLTVPPLRERQKDIPVLLNTFIKKYTTTRGREPIEFAPQTRALLMAYEWRGNVRELENLVQHMSILYTGKCIYPEHLPDKFRFSIDTPLEASPPSPSATIPSSMIDSTTERAELLAPLRPASPVIDFGNGPVNFNELVNAYEKELILEAMKRTSGNKKEAARMLNLKRTTLLEKIKKKDLTGLW